MAARHLINAVRGRVGGDRAGRQGGPVAEVDGGREARCVRRAGEELGDDLRRRGAVLGAGEGEPALRAEARARAGDLISAHGGPGGRSGAGRTDDVGERDSVVCGAGGPGVEGGGVELELIIAPGDVHEQRVSVDVAGPGIATLHIAIGDGRPGSTRGRDDLAGGCLVEVAQGVPVEDVIEQRRRPGRQATGGRDAGPVAEGDVRRIAREGRIDQREAAAVIEARDAVAEVIGEEAVRHRSRPRVVKPSAGAAIVEPAPATVAGEGAGVQGQAATAVVDAAAADNGGVAADEAGVEGQSTAVIGRTAARAVGGAAGGSIVAAEGAAGERGRPRVQ